ncbi:fumarate/nitrate reduction transcriptional regulator Fnr [Comamonas sp. NLF-1-9]|uniref:fumarate/nitrate reduction transcriptional regulator Fnr n=1 Tax=Comamonas sp. NLF-1-9 TaxID=2853163 RepID=UPI001C43FD33|nr:fumarate/nitrate reduction transcriptional regulator Fnr [Comamonas sp. NLF-1-9]QXL83290.1 fumarate/nitrate reduction transcriptional regulator Fnr [Comamonas sp. NLF-1-9]
MPHRALQIACSRCSLRELCMPVDISAADMERLDTLVTTRRRVKRGKPLYSRGDRFSALYAIRSGFFKTRVTASDGREQVTGFQMAGEIMGLDGIVSDEHTCDALALEDAEVCEMPYDRIESLSREVPALQTHVHKIMSREIVRDHGVMLLLGSMRAEERVASFLMNLLQRLHVRGFSEAELVLRMTREEIGSYLGLTLETVSRTFSRFADDGLIEVKHRQVRILDGAGLQTIVDSAGARR